MKRLSLCGMFFLCSFASPGLAPLGFKRQRYAESSEEGEKGGRKEEEIDLQQVRHGTRPERSTTLL